MVNIWVYLKVRRSFVLFALAVSVALLFYSSSAFAAAASKDADGNPLTVLDNAQIAYQAYQQGDFATAHELWYYDAKRGNAHAQYNLGILYAEGRGVERNPDEAVKWWHSAAEKGHARAQHNLALAYMGAESNVKGKSANPNRRRAIHWLNQSAKQGLANSQYFLARLFSRGETIEQDPERAVTLYREAAAQGHAMAQNDVAVHCKDGKGTKQDYVEAFYWSTLAAQQGIRASEERLQELTALMSKEELNKANQRLLHEQSL